MVMKVYEEEKYYLKSKIVNVYLKGNIRKEYCVCCQNISIEIYICIKFVLNVRVLNVGILYIGILNVVILNVGILCEGILNVGVLNVCLLNVGILNLRRLNVGMISVGGIEKVNVSYVLFVFRYILSKVVKVSV